MRPRSLKKIPSLILSAVLVVAPLLFGSVYPWAYGLLEIGILAAFLFLLWFRPVKPSSVIILPKWGLLCLMVFVTWSGVQLIPLPQDVVKFIAEPIYDLWQLDFLSQEIVRPHALLTLTLYPYATASTGLLFLCYLLAFHLAFKSALLSDDSNGSHRVIISTVVSTGFVVAMVGIVQIGLNTKAIYGFFMPLHSAFFTGPFVNYNHFAGYLELAIPLGISVLAYAILSSARRPIVSSMLWLYGGSLSVMIAAIFMSHSRGGILSFCLVAFCQLFIITILFRKIKTHVPAIALLLIFFVILGIGSYITNWSRTISRFQVLFQQELSSNLRWQLFIDVFQMSKQLPLTGTGLGTFAVGYPPFKTILRQGIFPHAHNDYLEILAETGWPGLLLFLGFVVWVLNRGIVIIFWALSYSKQGDSGLIGRALLVTGCLAGVISLLFHGLVDVNLRIPSNALTWFVLCGLIVGLSHGFEKPTRK
ncbi:MAG: O-antigen ligase family protein [Proteobacteria bacterium]|nr:O-antigen ligase family protein [Pseudomonadota bacterium]